MSTDKHQTTPGAEHGFATRAIHAGQEPDPATGATIVPIYQTSIAVDLQAHGRTADIDRPPSYESVAHDIGALIEHLGFERSNVMGYSPGGGVALQTAIRHPEVVRKLVVVSTPFKRDGWYTPRSSRGWSRWALEPRSQCKIP